ncbi:MAG: DUF3048 domain-containing protein [Acidimicrobiales bacterium]|jgi:archaellum component FlaC|nr:DUF3048 domain-containing protein [Acidimicrobiales bacterium]
MRRHSRTLLTAIAVCGLAAVLVATPAQAQIDPAELSELERRRDDLTIEIGNVDTLIENLAREIESLEEEVATNEVLVELVADEIEWTAFARQEPASTRIEIAIIGFTQGDPRQNELLNEIRTLEGDDEPARRRALYESVIDDTDNRLESIDGRLGDLQGELRDARAVRDESGETLAATEDAHRASGIARSDLAAQLTETLDRIDQLERLEERALLTGTSTFDDPTRPALAVKIDNVSGARPQAGINQADIVFVEEVEGGLTRLAAVFHSEGAEVVGPIRSMRTGDFDLLAQFNGPLFSNSGGNRGSRAALANSTLVDVGVNVFNELYYREPGRRAPHNLMSNTFNLWSVGRELEGAGMPLPVFEFRHPGDPLPGDSFATSSMRIDYGSTIVDYVWNGSSWDRSQDGAPTVDADGVRVSPTTVVVQFVDYVPSRADGASPEAVSTGEGRAWILTAGVNVGADWSRPELSDQTEYRVPGLGAEIPILPGKIWIELPRPGNATRN